MAELFTVLSSDDDGLPDPPVPTVFDTYGKTNFALFVICPALGTSGSDTFDMALQECDVQEFPSAATFTCRLTKPDGTAVSAITQITGALTSGNAALLQKFNLPDKNYSRFLKPSVTVGGTEASFKNMRVLIAYDLIKRTTI